MFDDGGGVSWEPLHTPEETTGCDWWSSWTDVGMDRFLRPALRVSPWGRRNVGLNPGAGVHICTRCSLI